MNFPHLGRRGFMGASALAAGMAVTRTAGAQSAPALNPQTVEAPWTDGGTVRRLGVSLSWRSVGPADAEPVVLLHKLGGWIADWRGVAPLIANGRRVIAFDLPGHGNSIVDGPPPYVQTVPETAALIVAALSQMGYERFTLGGNSLGGVVSTHVAAHWPEKVSRLIMASVSLFPGYDRARLAELEEDRNPAVYDAEWRPVPRASSSAGHFATLVPEVEIEQDMSRARADRWIRPQERGVGLFNTQAALARTIAPVLFVYGDRGHYVKYVDTGRDLRGDAKIVQFAETGSFVHQERPTETAAAINAFLDETA